MDFYYPVDCSFVLNIFEFYYLPIENLLKSIFIDKKNPLSFWCHRISVLVHEKVVTEVSQRVSSCLIVELLLTDNVR